MSYTTTPGLGLQLPVPGSGQAWQTSVYNSNLSKIDQAIRNLKFNTGTIKVGKVNVGDIAPNAANRKVVNFPSGSFTAPPVVVGCADNSRVNFGIATEATASSFELTAGDWTPIGATNTTVYWHAIPAS